MRVMDLNDGLFRFVEYYHYLESSFVDIVRIIPLENAPDTFSPRLYEILQSTCSQVEAIVKIMYKELTLGNKKSAAEMYNELNWDGVISDQEVVFRSRPDWKAIKPFLCDFKCGLRSEWDHVHTNDRETQTPKWWKAYNKSKHDLPTGYGAGNIENTYLALAGLYILHYMMHLRTRNKDDFLKRDSWGSLSPLVLDGYIPQFNAPKLLEVESDIFIPLGMLCSKQK